MLVLQPEYSSFDKGESSSKNSFLPKVLSVFLKMTTRRQKRKAVEGHVSRDIEISIAENNPEENPSKSPKIHFENLDEIKTSLKKDHV